MGNNTLLAFLQALLLLLPVCPVSTQFQAHSRTISGIHSRAASGTHSRLSRSSSQMASPDHSVASPDSSVASPQLHSQTIYQTSPQPSSSRPLEVKRVPSDSLVSFLRSKCGSKVYFIKDAEDVASYTVSAPRENFEAVALAELRSKGYSVSCIDGSWFVLHGPAISDGELPAGFFDAYTDKYADDGLSRLGAAESQVVTFRNKVYEIGNPSPGRTGKAFVWGSVRDVVSGEPLAGVAVYDDRTGVFVTTDADGFYRVALPLGENILKFSAYSMDDMALTLQLYGDGGLDVVMKEKVTSLKASVVSAESQSAHRDARMGVEKIRMNVVRTVPTAFGEADVLKVVLTLPGVKTVGEAATGFNVRGGATDQNLILFNDGTVFNPSHMFGLLSSFNSDVINDVELYKSSIPASLGGRISSVLDVKGKEGNQKKLCGNLGIGLLTSHVEIDGPIIKDRTSFVLGARTTYSNWMLKLLPAESSHYAGGAAAFSDVNIGLTHKINESNTVQAFGYWSADKFSFASDTTFHYSNLNASLKWKSHFADRHTMTLSAGYDAFGNQLDDSHLVSSSFSFISKIQQFYARLNFTSVYDGHTLSYGLQSLYYDLNPGSVRPFYPNSYTKNVDLPHQNAVDAALYAGDVWTVSDRLSVDAGIRLSNYLAMSPVKYYLHPELRLSCKYSFLETLSLKAGFNSMSQNIHMISNSTSVSPMDSWHLSSAGLRPQTGWQGASGLYWSTGQVNVSLEGYYKRMYHYIDNKSGAKLVMNPDLEDALVETTGRAYGAELMIRKSAGKLNGWLSYTYSRTFLREAKDRGIETINGGEWYNAPHDKPHDVKLVANYKFTHRYSISMNLDYSTGRPITIPVGRYQINGKYYLAFSERNVCRIPDYFRMDAALNVEPGHYLKQLAHMSFTIGVYNVTGRRNAYSVYYTNDEFGRVKGHMLSVFAVPVPYINLNLKF